MGDQIGEVVEGTLYYIAPSEFDRVRNSSVERTKRAAIFADMCRLNALYMIARAGSGHIGSSFSSMEIFTWLLSEELNISKELTDKQDIFFSSKGHDAPGYYAVQMAMARLPFDLIHKLRRIDGLPGHPDIGTSGIITNTGSLGMGVSKAKGMVIANRQKNIESRIFVLTGDGELQEGQFWESLISAANFKLHEITVIIDHNKLQSDTFVKNVSDLGDIEAKLKAFGWAVARCDGNNIEHLSNTINNFIGEKRPKIIIADTIKGKGVSFMEHTSLDSDVGMYRFHSGAPDVISYRRAAQEIIERLKLLTGENTLSEIEFEQIQMAKNPPVATDAQRLVNAYSRALIAQAKNNKKIIALDADLILDTGLIPFKEAYPKRFIECGIAEQDMVSMAGGMALRGLMPIVHSFACFLSSRPNEQIYNNATEKTKIIYVGSLAGVTPGGPGHSHQAVRDISALSAIPNLTIVEPSCEAEVDMLLDWCVNKNNGSSYLRLVSLPCEIPFSLQNDYKPEYGKGVELIYGDDVVIFGYGPILLSLAWFAAQKAKQEHGISVKLINLPWINYQDPEWITYAVKGCKKIICLDNHYSIGGQADRLARVLSLKSQNVNNFCCIGLNDVPPCGANLEVLNAVGLTSENILNMIIK